MLLGRIKDWVRRQRRPLGLGLLLLTVTVAIAGWFFWEPHYWRMLLESPTSGRCEQRLGRDTLSRSLELARGFLVGHQKPEGNFDYEYDFSSQSFSPEDHDVRQVGALWGLSLLHRDRPGPDLQAAIERGFSYFHEHSKRVKGRRCIAYPGVERGGTGTIALMALSYIEYLRSGPPGSSEQTRQELHARLREYLKQLEYSLRDDGVWHGEYDSKTCAAGSEPSSYADGEALLALAKARKYLDYKELEPTLMRAAAAGRKRNIDDALAAHPDSDITKGYYQWSSMAFYELVTSDIPDTKSYGDTLLRLADWMIDEHDTLWRTRNTGYAYEGIIHAYALAKQRGDAARMAKYACVVDVGLSRLLAWQVGGPLASGFANQGKDDRRALGGFQNAAREAPLRIDVTQHQSHALLLALQYIYRPSATAPR